MNLIEKFNETEKGFDFGQAIAEADRCLLCHEPPCSSGCPASTDPGGFIRKLRLRNITGAIRVIKENNILGGTCSLVCPTCSLCGCHCSATELDRPIRIGEIQRWLIEHGWERGMKFHEVKAARPEKIAVVGSGPAGLTCGAELAKEGFQVTIFEKMPEPGGVLRYGIPNYRLIRSVLEKEIDEIRDLGVKIICNHPVQGKNGIDQLFTDGFKAVFIAVGTWRSTRLKPDKQAPQGVLTSVEFLKSLKETDQIETMRKQVEGKDICVIGGGAVAADCAISAARLGAANVHLVYRRSFLQMPATEDERQELLAAGVHLQLLNQPTDYVAGEDGTIASVALQRTRLGEPDKSGRPRPETVPGSGWTLPVDMAIEAIGLEPSPEGDDLYGELGLTGKRTLSVDEGTGETSRKFVFAGGDLVRGPSLVSWAVRDGKVAAREITQRLTEVEVQA